MHCPFCQHSNTEVVNSRITKGNSQVWRRRRCTRCHEVFTSHEIIDLSHLLIQKKSGKIQKYDRMKVYSGIYGATIGSKLPNREYVVDKITREVERQILLLKKKTVISSEISDIILFALRRMQSATFLRYLAYCKNISNEVHMRREFMKYQK